MAATLIPFQQSLRPSLPTVEGNVDYRKFRDHALPTDQILTSGPEQQFVAAATEQWIAQSQSAHEQITASMLERYQTHSRRALRCNILRTYLQEGYRDFAAHLADSPLLHRFCLLDQIDIIKVPAKSSLQRYTYWVDQKTDSKKHRKKVLRKMDKLIGTVANHARRYRQLLDEQWQKTQWTRPQAEQVLRRLDNVLEQLPAARKQARQRIIQEQPVANEEKILSLYESAIRVVVRHKAGAEVEFGNTLLLGESRQGLIMHWELFEESAPADARLVKRSVESIEENLQIKIKELGADRGFDSASIQNWLAEEKTYNGVCPRDPHQLKERMRSWKFVKLQRRRSQTEGRISIIIHNFLGCPIRSKGIEHRQLAVGWGVLTHNLWVLARLPKRQAKKKKAPLRKAD